MNGIGIFLNSEDTVTHILSHCPCYQVSRRKWLGGRFIEKQMDLKCLLEESLNFTIVDAAVLAGVGMLLLEFL